MLIGYARVSTLEQNLDLQNDALKKAGCEKIYTDTLSGAKAQRPGLEECLAYARTGDTVVVWKLDRLGRNLKHLIETVQALDERGIGFKSVQESIDTTTPGGKLVFHVFGALAEFERDLIRERTLAGLAAARARGRTGGRKPVLDAKGREVALALFRDKSLSVKQICKTLGVSRTTFYRYLPEAVASEAVASEKNGQVRAEEKPPDAIDPRKEPRAEQAMQPSFALAAVSTAANTKVPAVVVPSTPPSELKSARVETESLEAARLLLRLGPEKEKLPSPEFRQARHDLSDVIPTLTSSADVVEWARGEVTRADKAS